MLLPFFFPHPLPLTSPISTATTIGRSSHRRRCLLHFLLAPLLPAPISHLQPTLSSSSLIIALAATTRSYFLLCCCSNRTLLPLLLLLPPSPSVAPPNSALLCCSVAVYSSVIACASHCNAQPSGHSPSRRPLQLPLSHYHILPRCSKPCPPLHSPCPMSSPLAFYRFQPHRQPLPPRRLSLPPRSPLPLLSATLFFLCQQ
ncbi:hypothetical protein B296_00030161 [Ensete ventricosum]|uniref:Uncharacterized protein n=1 Tax=Ensete ventricosum TaxID=4639 RepID=A0A426Z4V6_ENSVE|nr:hypothetical protein B296_00030161 [Ensete ventricosum]